MRLARTAWNSARTGQSRGRVLSHVDVEEWVNLDSPPRPIAKVGYVATAAPDVGRLIADRRRSAHIHGPRKTPRVSLILILCDDRRYEPKSLPLRLPRPSYEEIDTIVVACAGIPGNIDELKRNARGVQFLHAPEGTSAEDLRELAMEQTPGDIVTLLSARHLSLPGRDQLATG